MTQSKGELVALAERCEQAVPDVGASLSLVALEDEVKQAVWKLFHIAPQPFLHSLDAALALAPSPAWEWSLEWEAKSDGEMFARCAMGDPMRFQDCEAATPALALCAAALKARAHNQSVVMRNSCAARAQTG
jgi:hypothetical protein